MRWVAGLVLVVAAVLKSAELFHKSSVISPSGGFALPLQIGLEFMMGLIVLSDWNWQTLRRFSIFVFSGFASYSLYLARNGAAMCGCFGSVPIHPWYTFFLDLALALGLLVSVMRDRRARKTDRNVSRRLWLVGRKAIVISMIVAVIAVAILVRYIDRGNAIAGGATTGDVVALEPKQWIGKPLPIVDAISLDLSAGRWTVLLHRHDCPDCQAAVPRYEERASRGERVALVEVPPYGQHGPRAGACHYCRLKDDHKWFVETPVEIELENGVVAAAKSHGD